jgi:hypothetical protein
MSQRDSNGTGNGSLPQWAAVVWRIGVPSAIALFLVYRLTATLDTRLELLQARQADMHEQLREHMANSAIAIHLARRLCINTAKTDEQVRECLR